LEIVAQQKIPFLIQIGAWQWESYKGGRQDLEELNALFKRSRPIATTPSAARLRNL